MRLVQTAEKGGAVEQTVVNAPNLFDLEGTEGQRLHPGDFFMRAERKRGGIEGIPYDTQLGGVLIAAASQL
jgi:hypothetical protein